MPLTSPPSHVAIIGGGLAGLTLALALHDLNIPSSVYEARAENDDQGGGIMLSPNALRVLDSIGVYERIKKRSFEFDALYLKNEQDQKVDTYDFGSKKKYTYDAIRIMRKELLDELRGMIREPGRKISLYFDHKLKSVHSDSSDQVVFTFDNGESKSAPLLIGADGIHSEVRKSFLPQENPFYEGLLGISSVVKRSDLRIPENYGLPAMVTGKAGAFLLVPQKPDGSEFFIGSQRPSAELDWKKLREAEGKQKLYDMLQEGKSDWPDVVQSALEATRVDRMGFWAFHSIPKLPSWLSDSKRIILVGDAAHAIPPIAGQGANQAFEDVRSLATLLSRLSEQAPLDKAALKWQTYRQIRVDKVLELNFQMNIKRLSEAERAKIPSEDIWSKELWTRALKDLYEPDLALEALNWIQELEQGK